MTSPKANEVKEIHRTNLRFLLKLKGTVGILHNLIHDNLALMAIAAFGTLFICGGIQGYQAFVGDLRGTGALEWPLRVLLVIGGFVVATPGGGIMPLSQIQVTALGLTILVPTVLIALVLIRRQTLVPNQLRAP